MDSILSNLTFLKLTLKKHFDLLGLIKFQLIFILLDLRVIPKGTVDNNLGQDRLAGPKVQVPN